MKELKRLNKYLWKYRGRIFLGFLFLVASNTFVVLPAQVVRQAVDLIALNVRINRLFEGTALQDSLYPQFFKGFLIAGLLILALALLRGFFLFLVRQTIIVMSRLVEYDLKNDIFAHYQTLPLSFYRRNNTGDLMARISEDVSKVRMYLGPGIMYGINLAVLFAMVIPIMYSISPRLTLYSLIPLPILSVSIYYVNNMINRRSEEIQRSLAGLSTYVQEAFSGIRVIKAYARELDSAAGLERQSNEYKDKQMSLTVVNSFFFPLIMGLIGLSVVLVIFIGGAEVINGSISPGVIPEFIIYINTLTWPVASLGWISSLIQRAAASQKRINEFWDEKTHIVSSENLDEAIKGNIRFEDVTFTYPDSGIVALKAVSFEVKSGQTLAVIGTTGSGKSTIASLISRLYDTQEGTVYIDERKIGRYKLDRLRSSIGYVPQDVFLFSDSIRNNIAFADRSLAEEAIRQAAEDADLASNIAEFPKGYDTQLGERGITLSGGQKQRLSIARAIARDPEILILDDSLSAVDTKTENRILQSLERIMEGRTSVIISHRVSSAKLADHIIVLDDGKIVERGTHQSLLEAKGAYAELYEKQLEGESAA